MKTLAAGDILLSPRPLPCQEEGCSRETHFAIALHFATKEVCHEHLFPHMRPRSRDALLRRLGNLIYELSLCYTTRLFKDEQRCWNELATEERQTNPLQETVQQVIDSFPEEHFECLPLYMLSKPLACLNAQTTVAAMGGEEMLRRAREVLSPDSIRPA